MILLDEIKNSLSLGVSFRKYHIDESIHGAIASIVTYGTLIEASEE